MSISLIVIYACAAWIVIFIFKRIPEFALKRTPVNLPPLSMIICARNEELYLETCLTSILNQNYPKELIEIMVINDGSNDATSSIANAVLKNSRIDFRVIDLAVKKGKKECIRHAVSLSQHEWIVLRDADTYTRSENWLKTLMTYAVTQKKLFVIAPVHVSGCKNVLTWLQSAESLVLAILTAVSAAVKKPFLCSGANLAFTKTSFHETGAFQSHLNLASGDDVMFLEEVKRYSPDGIGYVHSKNTLVYTYAQNTWIKLFQQRIRWASKVFVTKNPVNWLIAFAVTFYNLWFIYLMLSVFAFQKAWLAALFFVLIKLIIDILLVFLASRFFKQAFSMAYFVAAGFIYPFYAIIIAVGSFVVKPKWK